MSKHPDWAIRVRETIKSWPEADQRWWRELLDVAPREALVVASLALRLGAHPQGVTIVQAPIGRSERDQSDAGEVVEPEVWDRA